MKPVSVAEVETQLGRAIRQFRIDDGYSQEELAARANLSRSAVQGLELGRGGRIETLIRVLQALDRLDHLDALTPREGPTPMELLRASQRNQARTPKQGPRVRRDRT